MIAQRFQDLEVWQKAHQLVLEIYRVTKPFPREEMFGLTAQLRRAAASVAANIVEGFRRPTTPDKLKFYHTALASLDESEYHLQLAHDLGYANTECCRDRLTEVARMLNAYIRAITTSQKPRNAQS